MVRPALNLISLRTWLTGVLVLPLFGQIRPVISSIEVVGNEHTRDYVLYREIHHPTGAPLDSALAKEDRDRLFNLGIFADVHWRVVPEDSGQARLQYLVVESWRFLPGGIPVYDEKTGWSFSGGLIVNNFRGRNEVLSIGGSLGGVRTFDITFSDPWILGDHVSVTAEFGKSIEDMQYLPFEKTVYYGRLSIGRYAGYTHKFFGKLEGVRARFAARVGTDRTLDWVGVTGQYQYDTRDVYKDPTRGWNGALSLTPVFLRDETPFLIQIASLSRYTTLIPGPKPLVMGNNVSLEWIAGTEDSLWVDYLGGSNTVRGFRVPTAEMYLTRSAQERFGLVLLWTSHEFRKVVIPHRVLGANSEWGLTAVAFFDLGYAANEWSGLAWNRPLLGAGFGVRIPFPILEVLRLDWGWGLDQGRIEGPTVHFAFQQKF
ncbi:MAG: hypothetical protein D6762_01675 [Candidatus Neomarinimicrobiota bacterium]|nr:MAG: hypothetical protein D6762_01675 [Candidatus Neomarinimicrobiota bacterium]